MRSIEDKIDIPENRKDDFRREIMNYIGALAIEGKKFTHDTNDRLRRALEMKLFEDQKDSIKLSSFVSNVIDKDTQDKIDVIKSHGRLVDLIAVAKPDQEMNIGYHSLNAALFASARPVLMCPDAPPAAALGHRIAIAWNGSLEAARVIALTVGLIDKADAVVVLDGGAGEHGADGAALIRYLEKRGVTAERKPIQARSHPGRAILTAAAEAGADTLMMGAYGHSREMEAMLGGATRDVVEEARMPVIVAH